jgi:putative flippase GtrA
MSAPTSAEPSAAPRAARRSLLDRRSTALRYVGGSVVAAGCSEATLVVLYGLLHVAPGLASCLAWLAGAVPNYWLNRSWAWRRRGRPDLRREVLPYVVIVLTTLALATLLTGAVDRWSRHSATGPTARVVLVAGTFLAVYVAVFLLRFLLFDRLFTRLDRPAHRDGTAR